MRGRRGAGALAAAVCLVAAGPAAAGATGAPLPADGAPDAPLPATGKAAPPVAAPSLRQGATAAKIVAATSARTRPGARAGRVVWFAHTTTPWAGGPQQLLVLGSHDDAAGRRWLRVLLPIRPNGTSAWIPRDRVRLLRLRTWISVSLRRRTVTLYRNGRRLARSRAVIGAPATPTPRGLAAVYERAAQRPADGFLGPWALHLTALSDVLDDYGGGPGRVAIHGRDGASLLDPLGSARSHGCIRISDRAVRRLARLAPPGTPVRIR
ncbi:MAG: L,D-transpeptidase [Solirubrobacteraceae bacterium]